MDRNNAYLWGFMLYQAIHNPRWVPIKETDYPAIFERSLIIEKEQETHDKTGRHQQTG